MDTIHFLNVLEGDCNIIQHSSSRSTVIDVSNAYNKEDSPEETAAKTSREREERRNRTGVPSGKTDYKQKLYPDNPIDYIRGLGIKKIWRFVVTHPDMDHLDGIQDLYTEYSPINTWDTNNDKFLDENKFAGGYNKEDWKFYRQLRDGKYSGTKRLSLLAKHQADFWNQDNLQILCPTQGLVDEANKCKDYNESSYVLLFTPPKAGGGHWKFLFAGDTHDAAWEYILANFKQEVSNVDVLFAPHHGRDSGRNYDFLKTLNPRLTLMGNASHKHLAYSSYPQVRITNNQAGYVVLRIQEERFDVYVKNYEFAKNFRAKKGWGLPSFNKETNAWHLRNFQ
jgi:competence protein ComEC